MTDYKEMYLRMLWATEKAVDLMIAAQRECEELYVSSHGPVLSEVPVLPLKNHDSSN